jgi:hypothetical protein
VLDVPDYYRPRHSSAIWQEPPAEWREMLGRVISRTSGSHTPPIFFRADDIGAGGRAFEALCHLFRHHSVPLAMAVVPAWLSATRSEQLFRYAPLDEAIWGWHQHGWRHFNWQRTGKKSEFGEQRPLEKQWRDLWQGQQKMQEIFGEHLVPVFTPPWNRLSASTIKILHQLGFKAVSITGPLPRGVKPPGAIKNLRIMLDLHTRKETDGQADFSHLLSELSQILSKREPVGIMVHHQRMTHFAFQFLDELLHLLKNSLGARFMSFNELVQD